MLGRKTRPIGWRGAVLVALGVMLGAMMIEPAVAHVTRRLGHLINHLNGTYVNEGQAAGGDLTGTYPNPTVGPNAIASAEIADNAVGTGEAANDSLTGTDINESTLGQVPQAANADTLDSLNSTAFMRSSIYTVDPAPATGTDLGDGTFYIDTSCNPGDILLAGGPANVAGTSDLVESFPFGTGSWRGRIHKNGMVDPFNVVVLCADQ